MTDEQAELTLAVLSKIVNKNTLRNALWRAANPGRKTELKREWRKANREHERAQVNKYRAKLRASASV